jgi:signal transduction histidine kinase
VLIFLYNAIFTFLVHIARARGRIRRRIIVLLAQGQIVCDMIAVCALVHHTGGVENYFILLVLLPMVIATALLPQSLAYATAGGASVLINALAWGEQQGILKHIHAKWVSGEGDVVISGLYKDPIYVLQVAASLSAMSFAMVFIASAISKRLRQRESELEEAYQRLHEADETKSFFMRKAGHEMRAPLAAIYSILDGIAHDQAAHLTEEHRRLMGRAQKRTRALMELVSDLRRYSRLRRPVRMLHKRPLDLGAIVTQTVELFRNQAAEARLALSAAIHNGQVDGDEEMLRELVTNLVANAIQYTPPGGQIDVTLRVEDGWAVLAVADTGIGISEAACGRLFEEFYRAPEARKHFRDGTGLGLSICKRIAEMHGGRIAAAGRDGGGTVFTVHLPLLAGRPDRSVG